MNGYAIKIIRADNRFDRETLHRFSREIRILSDVHHPNVIQLHERNLDTEEKYPAFIMDLAECSLTQHLQDSMNGCNKRPCLDREEASLILRSVASGVQALHSAGIIHRDINPNKENGTVASRERDFESLRPDHQSLLILIPEAPPAELHAISTKMIYRLRQVAGPTSSPFIQRYSSA